MGFHYEAQSKKPDDEQKPKSGIMAKLGRGFGTALFRDGKIIIEPEKKDSSINE